MGRKCEVIFARSLSEAVDLRKIQLMFVERGVWIRPFGKLVYTMPAYTMNSEQLANLTAAMVDVVASI